MNLINEPFIGPVYISKVCTECSKTQLITEFYTVASGKGMYGGYVHVGRCKTCWNDSKKVKPRGFKSVDPAKQEKAIDLLKNTRLNVKEIAKQCGIDYNILGYWVRTNKAKKAKKEIIE